MANIFLSFKIVLYYKHLKRKKMRHVYQRIKIQSFEKKKKRKQENPAKQEPRHERYLDSTWACQG